MTWGKKKKWRHLRHNCPDDIRELSSLGMNIDNALVEIDRRGKEMYEDPEKFRTIVVQQIRRNIDRMEGKFFNLLQGHDDELNPDEKARLEKIMLEFRNRKAILNDIHEKEFVKKNPGAGHIEVYLINLLDTLERMIYDAIEEANERHSGDSEQYYKTLLKVCDERSGTLRNADIKHLDDDELEDVSADALEELEAEQELAAELSNKQNNLP